MSAVSLSLFALFFRFFLFLFPLYTHLVTDNIEHNFITLPFLQPAKKKERKENLSSGIKKSLFNACELEKKSQKNHRRL